MKNTKLFSALLSAGLLAGATGFTSCDEDEDGNSFWGSLVDVLFRDHEYTQNAGDNYFGWFGQDEDTEKIEDDINLVASSDRLTSLPSKVDLTNYLPPIGNQGQYGTCVGWAVAYNCRTFLYAKSKGLTRSSLGNTSNQFSPKDLFWSINDNYKGQNCNGTNFEYAFDVMIKRGIARLSTVPYTNLGSCSYNPNGTGGSSEAAKYKIKNYREIQVDKNTIKKYLSEGRLVVFGARLGDEFMNANTSDVLYSQSYGYTGQHAYHAMVCSGYDDTKGSNGAFRVVNSWGTNWGDDGYIWVDQNFFVNGDFAYCAFVAYDLDENTPSDPEID
ncbi:MAG: C1 family peptidase, partial [Bacteroidales bacterium]|nr:C1 family peptidase [Bacteroidales bacterium]